MEAAIDDCLVTGYEPLKAGLSLPDPGDVHVLAAAIRCGAQIIVTTNTKDFPRDVLEPFGLEAQHADVFIEHQLELQPPLVIAAAKRHRRSLKNPPKSVEEYLETLARQGLVVTAERLRDYAELL